MQGFEYQELKDYEMPEEIADLDKFHAEPSI